MIRLLDVVERAVCTTKVRSLRTYTARAAQNARDPPIDPTIGCRSARAGRRRTKLRGVVVHRSSRRLPPARPTAQSCMLLCHLLSLSDRSMPGKGSTCSHCAALNMAAHAACPPDLASPTPSPQYQSPLIVMPLCTKLPHLPISSPAPSFAMIYTRVMRAHAAPMIWSRAVNC